ncbi:hypothetical protein [Thermomonas flagellata]|uniref:hypothetical protein n=1 Tax=Thermomonas flagellata TaxID=2888524 RepID=UPI001F04B158|nr:hypothetical protein [Thermomonas flagellata]
MDALVFLVVVMLAVGVHSALNGVIKPLVDRAYPVEATPPPLPPTPAAVAVSRRRRRRIWFWLAVWILVGNLMQFVPF